MARVMDVKVRAITRFVVLGPEIGTWSWMLGEAGKLLDELAGTYESMGYDVQSLRIVLNPFGEFLDCSCVETALAGLGLLQREVQKLQGSIRIRCAIGAARSAAELALVPTMISERGSSVPTRVSPATLWRATLSARARSLTRCSRPQVRGFVQHLSERAVRRERDGRAPRPRSLATKKNSNKDTPFL